MELITDLEADVIFGYRPGRSKRLAKAGVLPFVESPGGVIRFDREEIERLVVRRGPGHAPKRPPGVTESSLLSLIQAADAFDVPVEWLREAAREGLVPSWPLGSQVVFDHNSLGSAIERLGADVPGREAPRDVPKFMGQRRAWSIEFGIRCLFRLLQEGDSAQRMRECYDYLEELERAGVRLRFVPPQPPYATAADPSVADRVFERRRARGEVL